MMRMLSNIKPAGDYATLLRQFRSLLTIAMSLETQLRHYQNECRSENIARKMLDSEREANAILTAELERK